MSRKITYRIESDSLGTMKVPSDAYYGIYTCRVLHNFPSGLLVPELFISTYIRVKKSYAVVNEKTGKLPAKLAQAIIQACDQILSRDTDLFPKFFPIAQIQSGGGTSTNMMVNEVIANVANEILGVPKGLYKPIHPNDHVNMSQSSNDTFPGVTKIVSLIQFQSLKLVLHELQKCIDTKKVQFTGIQKTGRTHLQDALKMNLSDEFSAFSRTIKKQTSHIHNVSQLLLELPFGATAIGTMQNINTQIRKNIVEQLSKEFAIHFREQINYFEGTSSSSDIAKFSSALSVLATDIIKICSDLRILGSGPRAGLQELELPEVQAGSSIMPGKVNPSIPEALIMICFKVIGNHHAIEIANMHSQLQLQVYSPVIAFNIYENIDLLTKGIHMLQEKCLQGIKAKPEEIMQNLNRSFVYATEYTEKLGYSKVAELVKKAYKQNLNLKNLLDV